MFCGDQPKEPLRDHPTRGQSSRRKVPLRQRAEIVFLLDGVGLALKHPPSGKPPKRHTESTSWTSPQRNSVDSRNARHPASDSLTLPIEEGEIDLLRGAGR
jgi:hypothetical protein